METLVSCAYLDDSPLCDHAKLGVRLAIGVLLDAQYVQAECALQLRVRHMCLLHTQTCRGIKSYESQKCDEKDTDAATKDVQALRTSPKGMNAHH